MHIEPVSQHHWLQQLIGKWNFEFVADMCPDQPGQKLCGSEEVRSFGPMWIIGEGTGESPAGGMSKSIMTIGYDKARATFVGTFISEMMDHLWHYDRASLNESKKVLTLFAEGPSFTSDGRANYKDVITLVNENHRTLESFCEQPDGTWEQVMVGHYHRVQ